VRDLYRRVMRVAAGWQARNAANTSKERDYIRSEARSLFHEHALIDDPRRVRQLVRDGEQRLEVALHYGIPYPRTANLPPGTSPADLQRGQMVGAAPPVYTAPAHPLFDGD